MVWVNFKYFFARKKQLPVSVFLPVRDLRLNKLVFCHQPENNPHTHIHTHICICYSKEYKEKKAVA